MIKNYNDFITKLLEFGFSGAVFGKNDGVFGLFRYGWGVEDGLKWHTDDPETDPWLWRIRVLEERNDIAYSKLFFKKAGFITKEWYPYFLSARREGKVFEEDYYNGNISHVGKRIYEAISENKQLALHEIKSIIRMQKDEKSKFDTALTELQMKMYITICGQKQAMSFSGIEYGWPSTMYTTTENFFGEDIFDEASFYTSDEAISIITKQIYKLNQAPQENKILKFIKG